MAEVKKTEEPKKTAAKTAAPKAEPKKTAAKTEAAPKAEPKKAEPKKPAPKKQYVTWREEDRVWVVKKEGSDKATKLFRTKAEAEEFANQLAENQGSRVVRQKKDGKFQKEKY